MDHVSFCDTGNAMETAAELVDFSNLFPMGELAADFEWVTSPASSNNEGYAPDLQKV